MNKSLKENMLRTAVAVIGLATGLSACQARSNKIDDSYAIAGTVIESENKKALYNFDALKDDTTMYLYGKYISDESPIEMNAPEGTVSLLNFYNSCGKDEKSEQIIIFGSLNELNDEVVAENGLTPLMSEDYKLFYMKGEMAKRVYKEDGTSYITSREYTYVSNDPNNGDELVGPIADPYEEPIYIVMDENTGEIYTAGSSAEASSDNLVFLGLTTKENCAKYGVDAGALYMISTKDNLLSSTEVQQMTENNNIEPMLK